jgi:hypothetical protein
MFPAVVGQEPLFLRAAEQRQAAEARLQLAEMEGLHRLSQTIFSMNPIEVDGQPSFCHEAAAPRSVDAEEAPEPCGSQFGRGLDRVTRRN